MGAPLHTNGSVATGVPARIISHGPAMGSYMLPHQQGQIGQLLREFPFGPLVRSNVRAVGVYGHKPSMPRGVEFAFCF